MLLILLVACKMKENCFISYFNSDLCLQLNVMLLQLLKLALANSSLNKFCQG